jgi:ABC-2 type transport system permease protein
LATGPLAAILCRGREERAFFRLFNLLMANDRTLKLRVYPSLGMAIAMPFVMLFAFSSQGSRLIVPDLSSGELQLLVYLVLAFIAPLSSQFKYSEGYKASWLYSAAPLSSPGPIFRAQAKAIIARYVIAVALIASAIFVALSGWRILGDMALFIVNSVLLALACMAMLPPTLPFSRDVKEAKNEVAIGKSFIMMGIAGALALIHWGASYLPWGIAANATLSIAAIVVVWKTRIAQVSWKDLKR